MKILRDLLRFQADTEAMRASARDASRSCANLTPIVPIASREGDGWFGGKPRLPHGVPWPERDGVPLCFACQVDLSRLPAGVWSGVGPRDGWLVVFLHPVTHAATVLHVRGEVGERDGPGQLAARWASAHASPAAGTDLLPRWPVKIEEGRSARAGSVNPAVNAWNAEKPDLANPAVHPFDATTLGVLLDGLEEFFVRQVKHMCRFPAMKRVRDDDLRWMTETKEAAFRSLESFYKVEGVLAPSRYRFEQAKVSEELPKLANLPTYAFEYVADDDAGYCRLEYRRSTLGELPVMPRFPPAWWSSYSSELYWHCVNAYTRNPQTLHPALRERMEQIWLREAQGFHGAMGHAPAGHIYSPHGPDTDSEVLLELPTSRMQGWVWGDGYSIVLLIERQALSRGDFADVAVDLTN